MIELFFALTSEQYGIVALFFSNRLQNLLDFDASDFQDLYFAFLNNLQSA
jgi:hypothetical protein